MSHLRREDNSLKCDLYAWVGNEMTCKDQGSLWDMDGGLARGVFSSLQVP